MINILGWWGAGPQDRGSQEVTLPLPTSPLSVLSMPGSCLHCLCHLSALLVIFSILSHLPALSLACSFGLQLPLRFSLLNFFFTSCLSSGVCLPLSLQVLAFSSSLFRSPLQSACLPFSLPAPQPTPPFWRANVQMNEKGQTSCAWQ